MSHHHHGRTIHAIHKKPAAKKDGLDYILYFFMIATPLFEIPQAWAIYSTQNAGGVSLWTWLFFFFSSFAWITYAIRHKILALFVTYALYMVLELVIVTGILLYS